MVELPIDALVASVFGLLLHARCKPRQTRTQLASCLALVACASTSLGFAVGACAPPSPDMALAVGTPLMIVLMILGVRNPSGNADTSSPPNMLPLPLRLLSAMSPVRWGVDTCAIAEFQGAQLSVFKPTPPSTAAAAAASPRGPATKQQRQHGGFRLVLVPRSLTRWIEEWVSARQRQAVALVVAGSLPPIGVFSTKLSSGDEVLRSIGILPPPPERGRNPQQNRRQTTESLEGSSSSKSGSAYSGAWKFSMKRLVFVTAFELAVAAIALCTVQKPRVVVATPLVLPSGISHPSAAAGGGE
mmetsp:Transcript_43671/g.86102  ORF Transcript_43671/g.86102 Transcript_43671/m.86102 type:complete len:301 (+) Transcript_43671:566-1468(+)